VPSADRRSGGIPAARVMLVVFDPELRDGLLGALHARGIPARTAESEREALALVGDHAVLLVDAKLPSMSGFDLAKSVRRHAGPDNAALIIITDVAWTATQKAAAIQQMGLRELLVKPVDYAMVADLVDRALAELPQRPHPEPPTVDTWREVEQTEPSVPSAEALADQASRDEKMQVERDAKAVQDGPVELRGNLTATPFPRLLHSLYRRRASGALFLLRDNIKKIVYFSEGHPTYIKSNLLTECLGKVLVREGMITEAQCKESLRRMKEERRQQGTVLIDMGVISPHNLVVGLQLQLQAKLTDIFAWARGEFLFKSNARIPSEVIRLDASAATLIADGIRGTWDEGRLREALEPLLDRHLVPAPEPELRFQELSLDEEEQTLADMVDGLRTLRQILSDTPLPTPKALAVAQILVTTGVVEARELPTAVEEPPPAAPVEVGEEPLRELLATQLLSLQQRDPYGVLGISVTAGDDAIEQAYSALAREYHPDRFRRATAETRRLADEIFGLIYQAYRTVATAELRARHHQSLGEALDDAPAPGEATLAAERLRREAAAAMAQQAWSDAVRRLTRAVELCPEAGDLRALLGWCIYQSAPEDPVRLQSALRELRRSNKVEPNGYQAYLYLGRIYADMGKSILAERQFEKAVQCNPDCTEALDELRRQKERRPPRRQPRSR
jgi:DNA-binding response OmpR family regulator/DnaJ-domain-containing protein 1